RRAGRSLPRPKAITAILAMYGILGLVAEMGREAERIAGAIAVVLLVATVFVGAAGKAIIDTLNSFTGWFSGSGSTGAASQVGAAASAAASAAGAAAGHIFKQADASAALRP